MTTSIAPNNAAIVYSPENWNVSAAAAIAVNAGAYFKVLFTGTSCTLNFNVSGNAAPLPQIWYRVNAYSPWVKATIASTVACTIPSDTTSATTPEGGLASLPNLLEVRIKSTTETQNRWGGVAAGVKFTGLTIDAGATVSAPSKFPNTVLFYGTSITEGYRTLGNGAASGNDTDTSDNMCSWASIVGEKLNAEYGMIGFGGTGLTVSGLGSVPALPSTYAFIYSGVSRTFSSNPNLIVIEEGYNDGSTNTTAALVGVLNALLVACPSAKILVTPSFSVASGNAVQKTYLQQGVAGCSNPSRVTYKDLTSHWISAQSPEGIHPFGIQNASVLAPAVASAVNGLLGSGQSAPYFRGGFHF